MAPRVNKYITIPENHFTDDPERFRKCNREEALVVVDGGESIDQQQEDPSLEQNELLLMKQFTHCLGTDRKPGCGEIVRPLFTTTPQTVRTGKAFCQVPVEYLLQGANPICGQCNCPGRRMLIFDRLYQGRWRVKKDLSQEQREQLLTPGIPPEQQAHLQAVLVQGRLQLLQSAASAPALEGKRISPEPPVLLEDKAEGGPAPDGADDPAAAATEAIPQTLTPQTLTDEHDSKPPARTDWASRPATEWQDSLNDAAGGGDWDFPGLFTEDTATPTHLDNPDYAPKPPPVAAAAAAVTDERRNDHNGASRKATWFVPERLRRRNGGEEDLPVGGGGGGDDASTSILSTSSSVLAAAWERLHALVEIAEYQCPNPTCRMKVWAWKPFEGTKCLQCMGYGKLEKAYAKLCLELSLGQIKVPEFVLKFVLKAAKNFHKISLYQYASLVWDCQRPLYRCLRDLLGRTNNPYEADGIGSPAGLEVELMAGDISMEGDIVTEDDDALSLDDQEPPPKRKRE